MNDLFLGFWATFLAVVPQAISWSLTLLAMMPLKGGRPCLMGYSAVSVATAGRHLDGLFPMIHLVLPVSLSRRLAATAVLSGIPFASSSVLVLVRLLIFFLCFLA